MGHGMRVAMHPIRELVEVGGKARLGLLDAGVRG